MGIFIQNANEIRNKVQQSFHNTENYVVAMQRRSVLKQAALLAFSSLVYTTDSCRTFILYFDPQGIYEAETSFQDKSQFLMMPWHEISDFTFTEKANKVNLSFSHLGKERGYQIDFHGNIMQDNSHNVKRLIEKNWYRIEG